MAPRGENLPGGTIGAKTVGRTATAPKFYRPDCEKGRGNFFVPARVAGRPYRAATAGTVGCEWCAGRRARAGRWSIARTEFFDGEGVATAGFLKRKQAAADGSNDLGLAPDDPALRARCRQIGDRQRAAVRPDNVFCPWSEGLRHGSTHALDFGNAREMYRPRLKICLNGTLQLDHCRRNAAARPAARCRKSLELVDLRAFGQSLDAAGPLSVARGIPKNIGIPMV